MRLSGQHIDATTIELKANVWLIGLDVHFRSL
jgi:hypothetical protein